MSNGEYLDQLSLGSKSPGFRDSKNEQGSNFSIFIYKYLSFIIMIPPPGIWLAHYIHSKFPVTFPAISAESELLEQNSDVARNFILYHRYKGNDKHNIIQNGFRLHGADHEGRERVTISARYQSGRSRNFQTSRIANDEE
jgi:hypothetical protein